MRREPELSAKGRLVDSKPARLNTAATEEQNPRGGKGFDALQKWKKDQSGGSAMSERRMVHLEELDQSMPSGFILFTLEAIETS